MNSRRRLLTDAAARLDRAGASDARLDAEWLLAEATGVPRLMLLIDAAAPVDDAAASRFAALLDRRAAGEPLQYVLGEAAFMGRPFAVDARVLIPRPDTETLCMAAIERIRPGMRVLDIGTGSGALAVTLALACPEASVTAVDISDGALAVARANAARHGASVAFVRSDLFTSLEDAWYDRIVSNPPYIRAGDLETLQAEVRREPTLALDGGADGLDFYRRIAEALPAHLTKGGALLLEVGDGQAADVVALLRGHFKEISTLRDLAGLERVVVGDGYAG